MNIIDIIKKRKSVRGYKSIDIEKNKLELIDNYIKDENNLIGPFGNKIRLDLMKSSEKISKSVKGSKYFIICSYIDDKNSLLDVGYITEKIVLFLTELELGSCYLASGINRRYIREKLDINNHKILLAISLGYADNKYSIKEKILRFATKANKRKNINEIFFNKKIGNPIKETNNEIILAMEMLRLSPSHRNSQPWIIVKDSDLFHFYIRNRKLNINMCKIDIGIAMLHFEKVLNENNIEGLWFVEYPLEKVHNKNINYMSTFKIM